MRILTIEGIIRNGQIELSENISLPENTIVYVVIPSLKVDASNDLNPQLSNKDDSKGLEKIED